MSTKPDAPSAVSGAPEALKDKFQTGPLLLDAIRASIAHLDFLTPVQRALILDNASCAVRSAVMTEIMKVEQLAAPVSPLRDAEGATAEIGKLRAALDMAESKLDVIKRERDEFKALASVGTWHDDCRPNRRKAAEEIQKSQRRIDSLSEQLAKARAALFQILQLHHCCDSYFGEGADECAPCIAQRALDEAQK